MSKDEMLTVHEAYNAMVSFLDIQYKRTGSDELAVLLGGMSLLRDGTTADDSAWEDWEKAVAKARGGEKLELKLTRD